MSKVWKWIIGIVAVLLIAAVILGAGFLVVSHWGGARWMMGARSFEPYEGGRVSPWKNTPRYEMPMHPGWDMPMAPGMAGRRGGSSLLRFGGIFPLGMIFGTLFWAALVFFAVLGVISLVRGRKNIKKQATGNEFVAAAPAAPLTSEAPAVVENMEAETPAQETATCSNCGHEVQEDWSHCPYCGQKLK
jgi:hypothetical protein